MGPRRTVAFGLVALGLFHQHSSAWNVRHHHHHHHHDNNNCRTLTSTVASGETPIATIATTTRRRTVLERAPRFLLGAVVAVAVRPPEEAHAGGELFRPNPLTNPVLEQLRIWNQAEADNIRYGGELERGDAGNRGKVEAYPKLLVPILEIADELTRIQELIAESNFQDGWTTATIDRWKEARRILGQSKYEKIQFKKIFNAYGDNIYYSDPDRANLYLAGGATPKTEQSLAYLLRNDVLTNIEDMQAELNYLIEHPEDWNEDLENYANKAVASMERYLKLVPPREMEQAQELRRS